jgi:hypothetical protein
MDTDSSQGTINTAALLRCAAILASPGNAGATPPGYRPMTTNDQPLRIDADVLGTLDWPHTSMS